MPDSVGVWSLIAQVQLPDANQMKDHTVLIRMDAVAYYGVIMTGLFLLAIVSWMKALRETKAALDERVRQEMAHKAEIKAMLNAERERSLLEARRTFAQEHVAAGFLHYVKMGALVVRKGDPAKLKILEPADPTAATREHRIPDPRSDPDAGK